jgi:hypothetical protein
MDNSSVAIKPYAYVFKYQSIRDVELLAALMKNNVKVRSAEKRFAMDGGIFEPGTLVVTRRNNEHIPDFDSMITSLSNELNRKIYTAKTGFVEEGKDFGSSDLNFLKMPKIAVLFGEQTSSLSAGEIWHFFEQQIHFPITQIGCEYFKGSDLKKYNMLIVPRGDYNLFNDSLLEQMSTWVDAGGKLILMGNALNSFADKKGFGLQAYTSDDERNEAEIVEKERKEKEGFVRYGDAERKGVSETIQGAIYKIQLDNSHPLAFGMRDSYFTLKTNELHFGFLTKGWNVGFFKDHVKPVQGFAGFHANSSLDNSLLFGVEEKGRGEVVYLVDDPLFRSFWENGKMLFANAVFMVGQ